MRCFLFRHGDGSEVLRWFLPNPDSGWVRQAFKYRLPDGPLVHTGDNPSAVVFMPELVELIEAGKVVEL